MASHHKLVVVESEKSPKICSTNWKEGMILKRNLVDLERSEVTVVNRITVDQKILLSRFQTKLKRSKMSYARTMGNMKLQKKLRDKNTFVLNTNIGHNQEQDETLQRLWNNGQKEYQDRIDADIYLRKKKLTGTFSSIEDDTRPPDTPKSSKNDLIRPYTALNVRPDTAVTLSTRPRPRRPHTSIQIKPKQPGQDRLSSAYLAPVAEPETVHRDVDKELSETSEGTKTGRKPRPQTARESVQEDKEFLTSEELKNTKRRPSTAGAYVKGKPSWTDSSRKAQQKLSGRQSNSKQKLFPSSDAGIGSLFKSDDFEISLLDFQRFCVYSANYENRVKQYGNKIKPLMADKAHSVDYYTSKLQESAKKAQKTLKLEAAAEATPEDIKRATGDISIRSLTLQSVHDSDVKPT